MDIMLKKPLLARKGFKAFSLPLVLIVTLVLFFFLNEFFVLSSNRMLLNKSLIEKELLNDVMSMANKLMEDTLKQKGTGIEPGSNSFLDILSVNPKIYLDMNGDFIKESVAIYTCTNISTTKIDFAVTAYRLKRQQYNVTNHQLLIMPMDIGSTRQVKILSKNFTTETQMSEFIQFSMVTVNSIRILDKLIQFKKLNLVSID
jgi:hypothetical protein